MFPTNVIEQAANTGVRLLTGRECQEAGSCACAQLTGPGDPRTASHSCDSGSELLVTHSLRLLRSQGRVSLRLRFNAWARRSGGSSRWREDLGRASSRPRRTFTPAGLNGGPLRRRRPPPSRPPAWSCPEAQNSSFQSGIVLLITHNARNVLSTCLPRSSKSFADPADKMAIPWPPVATLSAKLLLC